MIEIDGSDGGGQLVRTALSLSAITGDPVAMEGVRGARSNPGLRPQHLAVLELLTDVCDADVSEVGVGAREFTFRPGTIEPGEYGVDVGTAGSIALLFDAVLPLALAIESPLSITTRGGTDVKWSPPLAYQSRVKFPLLRDHGLLATVERERPGFYPAGGGIATLTLGPSTLDSLSLTDRGGFEGARVYSLASESLAEDEVAERQASSAVDGLAEAGFDVSERVVTRAGSDSPGSSLVIRLDAARSLAGTTALGERGKSAERVGEEAVEGAIAFRSSGAAVDRHLADQLVLPLAIAGGRVRIPAVTDHVETHVTLLEAFELDVRIGRETPPALVAPGTDPVRRTD